jgi:ATP-binding cassette subfamily B (MDR/TAP) protein 1
LIRAGETTFVIGKSGSGKSTLGQLLARFYQPSSGQILLDDVPIEHLDVKWLRRNVTLVEQHSVLFNDTIRHNLALGQLGATVDMQDIRNAIKFAMLQPVVEGLPDGLDTDLGIKGGSLSGGQRQRMAIARARIRNSPVLILDESTSSLDYVTRAEILDAIRSWRRGKTTIIITHDISQIQPNDFLYLLENARVVQEGYREQLEHQDGALKTFLDTQAEHNDDHSSYGRDEVDDDCLLYGEPRTSRIVSMPRPLSAVYFGQSVLVPYPEHTRASWGGTVPVDSGMEPRLSIHEQTNHQSKHTEKNSETVPLDITEPSPNVTVLEHLPATPSPVQMTFLSKDYGSMPVSRSNSHRLSLSISKDYGSRPGSVLSTRPTSLRSPYPRPLTTHDSVPTHLETARKDSGRHKLLSRLKTFRKKKLTEVQDDSTAPLPMIEIFMSVWPTIGWVSRLVLLGAFFSAMIHSTCTPVFAWLFAQLLTTFYKPGPSEQASQKYALGILGVAAIDGISSYFMFFLSDTVAQAWTLSLKKEAMRRILMQPREFFEKEENSVSRLAETLDHFAEEARNLPGRFACVFLAMIMMICVSIFWSMVIAWKLALVALATGPVLFAITKCYNMVSSRWERSANEAADKVGQVLQEVFVNIKTVRCLVLEDHFRKKYTDATTEAVSVGIKRAIYSASIHGLSFTGVIFVTILLYWYGGYLMSKNEYTVSEVMECFLVLMLSVNQISYMSNYVTQINMSRDAGSRLLRLTRLPTDSHELTGKTHIESTGDISLNKVNFRYPTRPDVQVLHDVSFEITQGSCTAIVGPSGSGKSTIASLLLKLYQTDAKSRRSSKYPGDMSVSNQDIKNLHTTNLRSRMAIVSQTPVLFPGTVAENIAYGLSPSLPESSIESIRAAASAAGICEFIDSLPQGYNTLIGEGGTGLSGGQAQRLCIARALVRNPNILILDEATSALDVASAQTIRETILRLVHDTEDTASTTSPPMSPRSRPGWFWDDEEGEWDYKIGYHLQQRTSFRSGSDKGNETRKRMTVIIITHAREMMAIAEHVIMLDQGRVVEQGSYSEMKRKRNSAFGRLLRGVRE